MEQDKPQVVWFEYNWRVQKEEMRKKNLDECMASSELATIWNGLRYHWQLQLYPKGKPTKSYPSDDDQQTDITLLLWICKQGIKSAVEAKYKMAIVGSRMGDINVGPTAFYFRRDMESPSRGKFRASGIRIQPYQELDVIGTTTEVEFRVQIGIRETDFDAHHLFPDPPLNFCPKRLFFYQQTVIHARGNGDAVLVTESERLHCHRQILALSSPVFQSMFKSDINQESQSGEVIIKDVSAQTFKQLLYFFYVEALPEDWKEDVLALLYAAHKYDVESLELLCEKEAVAQLSLETAAESLVMGNLLALRLLEMKAAHFVLDNWEELPEDKKEELNGNTAVSAALDLARNMEKAVKLGPN